MLRFVRFTVRTLATVSLVAAPLGAQGAATSPSIDPAIPPAATIRPAAPAATVGATVSLAPRVDAVTVGVRANAASPAPAPEPRPGTGDTARNRALMIVGSAALLVGSIIRDTPGRLIMVGGAVVGLYGLYRFLQ